jgi:hypothetical protein
VLDLIREREIESRRMRHISCRRSTDYTAKPTASHINQKALLACSARSQPFDTRASCQMWIGGASPISIVFGSNLRNHGRRSNLVQRIPYTISLKRGAKFRCDILVRRKGSSKRSVEWAGLTYCFLIFFWLGAEWPK